ncbi:hypothetical protein [Dyadobacter sp. NIV53]|uniref:hypothetical protein n=1 Tax=Dyadobacter sp. NIV53 TaxID=2861765 RepID=UPI001C88C678|nr:hypothetical protein [Dyadobacter sp. NIV53]
MKIEDEQHFTQIVIYQHANVVKHGILKSFVGYPWSSYNSLLSVKPTILQRDEVLEWFGGREEFIRIHREQTEYFYDIFVSVD